MIDIKEKFNTHPKLGEILIYQKKITIDQLDKALSIQSHENIPVGEVLIRMGVINMQELLKALDLQINIDKLLSSKYKEL